MYVLINKTRKMNNNTNATINDTSTPDFFELSGFEEQYEVSDNLNWDVPDLNYNFELLTLNDLSNDDEIPNHYLDDNNYYYENNEKNNSQNTLKDISIYVLDKYRNSHDDESCECPICFDAITYETVLVTNCNHKYCSGCVMKYLDTCIEKSKSPCCALCREKYTLFEVHDNHVFDELNNYKQKYDNDYELKKLLPPPNVTMRRNNWTSFQSSLRSPYVSFDLDTLFD